MNVVSIPKRREAVTPERWLTFKEAQEVLEHKYGLHTSWRQLEKLAAGGRHGAMPSKLNFGKRQVQLSAILPWLRREGIIER